MTPAQRRQAWKALLDNLEERTFTRDRWSVTITDAGLVNVGGKPAFRMAFTLSHDGDEVLSDTWVALGGPPVMVEDGEETNPDYNPSDPTSRPTRRKYRQDVRAAFRQHFIDVMQGVIAQRAAR